METFEKCGKGYRIRRSGFKSAQPVNVALGELLNLSDPVSLSIKWRRYLFSSRQRRLKYIPKHFRNFRL